jgi:hypothetical protein
VEDMLVVLVMSGKQLKQLPVALPVAIDIGKSKSLKVEHMLMSVSTSFISWKTQQRQEIQIALLWMAEIGSMTWVMTKRST